MRAFTFFLGLTLLLSIKLAAAAAEPAKVPSDEEATRLLVGGWVTKVEAKENMSASGTTIFGKDGRFSGEGAAYIGGKVIKVAVKGTWRVEKGVLIEEITWSSRPTELPVGDISRDVILKLDGRLLVSRTVNGDIEQWQKDPG